MNTIREVTAFIPTDEAYEDKKIITWEELTEVYVERFQVGRWIFRGHDCQCRAFKSSLERSIKDLGADDSAELTELNLLREFRRRAHHYLSNPPDDRDTLQWLALMRHFGAPSRLLDWTYSFWVAAFFAVEQRNPHFDYGEGTREAWDKQKCSHPSHAVWAIDTSWFSEVYQKAHGSTAEHDPLHQDGGEVSRRRFLAFLESRENAAYPVNPFRLNERIVAQQSVFLCPSNVDNSFDDVLARMSPPQGKVICVRIDPEDRPDFVTKLGRMNINRAVLFPGLEGFANSLKLWFATKDNLVPGLAWAPEEHT